MRFTFKELFVSNNQRQQEAVIPLFSLISSEIIRPLTVSQYMAIDPLLLEYIQQAYIDEKVIYNYIASISSRFNTVAFIAIEKIQQLIDSTGKVTELLSTDAKWFHRLKAIDKIQYTDFGNAEDPHLFFDVKLFNQ